MKEFKLDEINKISPGFDTPEGYFDLLEDRIMQRIGELPESCDPENRVIRLNRKKIWIYAAAAVVVIALGSSLFWNPSSEIPEPEVLENYLAYQTSINQFDLMNVLDSEDIREIQTDLPVEDKAIEEFITNNPDFEPLLIE